MVWQNLGLMNQLKRPSVTVKEGNQKAAQISPWFAQQF